MSAADCALECLGGGVLVGDRWVRALYLDESGIGKLSKDPILVVAGVLIHADTQWRPLAEELKAILDRNTPHGVARPKYLHAKDIYHGSNEFNRQDWSEAVRQKILYELSRILIDFDLPVVWCAVDRNTAFKSDPERHTPVHVRDCYSACALACFMQAEAFMRQLPSADEVASVTLEENKELQKRLPELLEFAEQANDKVGLLEGWRDFMPFTRLIDRPNSQPKSGSSILQLADYCAFAIKRASERKIGRLALGHDFVSQFLRIKRPDPNDDEGYWNPKFMPKAWGNRRVVFQGGEFVFVPEEE